MLCFYFPLLKDHKIVRRIKDFFSSLYYIIFIIAVATLSNLFGLELFAYYIFTMTVILVTLFADDTLPFAPMIVTAYMTVSPNNNPATNPNSLFSTTAGKVNLIIIASIIAVCVVVRFIQDAFILKERDGRGKGVPKLTYGFLALGLVYILGGLFGNYYDLSTGMSTEQSVYGLKTSIYGGVQIISLSFFYFYLYFTVNWKRLPENYFSKLFSCVGVMMVFEVVRVYFNPGAVTENGVVRKYLMQGWGIYNNVGCIMAMTIPAPFTLAIKSKNKIGWFLLGTLFFLAVLATHSRGSMLCGSIIYGLSLIVYLLKIPRKSRNITGISIAGILILIISITLIFPSFITKIFKNVLDSGLSDSGRFKIYANGIKQFLANPILGNGFYECTAYSYGDMPSFIPPRYHNTIIQILASSGILGILAYGFHRFQTLALFFKNRSTEKIFMFFSVLALLTTSLLDCNFFNLGPGLLYSVILLLAEGQELKTQAISPQLE